MRRAVLATLATLPLLAPTPAHAQDRGILMREAAHAARAYAGDVVFLGDARAAGVWDCRRTGRWHAACRVRFYGYLRYQVEDDRSSTIREKRLDAVALVRRHRDGMLTVKVPRVSSQPGYYW